MELPPDARQLPWYITLAVNTVYDALDYDIWAWKPHERTRVFVAALDAEPLGWSLQSIDFVVRAWSEMALLFRAKPANLGIDGNRHGSRFGRKSRWP